MVINIFFWGEPLRALRALASGYSLHHLRGFHASHFTRYGGSAAIPLAGALSHHGAIWCASLRQYSTQKNIIIHVTQ